MMGIPLLTYPSSISPKLHLTTETEHLCSYFFPLISRCDNQASEMGKHLQCKNSYTGFKDGDDPGCIWAFFRILGYHNVKRILPYNQKKQKPPRKTSKRKVKPKHHQICPPYEPEEDQMKMNSASVNYDTSVVGLAKKKSIKAKIKALLLIADVDDKPRKLDLVQKSQLKVVEHLSAPTLISLLKANPKPNTITKRIEESSNLEPQTRVEKKGLNEEEEEVGVLEVFKVNEELFLKVLKNSPLRKPRLAKSRTFPSPNPSHKHNNEIWPVITCGGNELKRSKSHRMGRSSSLKDSLHRYAPLFDTKINKDIKKGFSRSFKLSNERELEFLGPHHLRRSSREKLSNLEIESYSEPPQANLEGIKLDSPRDFDGHDNEEEDEQMAQIMTIQEEGVHNQDSYYKEEEFLYVKYVLDLMGFTAGEDPYGVWHSVEQPLDPALFDGIEVCCPFEPKSSKKEAVGMTTNHRKVLFDLINEALLYVHERSYVCYPKALSNKSHVRPMPKGKNRVVEEVWEFMRQYLRWRPEMDSVLNLAVPLELYEEGNGWMNLQTDCEWLAIYLQHLIVDDLLDEIVYS